MKPYFVSIEEGRRVVHWPRLMSFAAVVFVVTALVVEGLWYLVAHTLSTGALVVAVVIAAIDRDPGRRRGRDLPGGGAGDDDRLELTARIDGSTAQCEPFLIPFATGSCLPHREQARPRDFGRRPLGAAFAAHYNPVMAFD